MVSRHLGGMRGTNGSLRLEMVEKTIRLRLEICPYNARALSDLALLHMEQGRVVEALKIGLPMISISWITHELPDAMEQNLVVEMAEGLIRTQKTREAEKILARAIDPDAPQTLADSYAANLRLFAAERERLDALAHALMEDESLDLAGLMRILGERHGSTTRPEITPATAAD